MPTIDDANSYFEYAYGATANRISLSTNLTGDPNTVAITRWSPNPNAPFRAHPGPQVVLKYTLTSSDFNPSGRRWRMEKYEGTGSTIPSWVGAWRTGAGTYTEAMPVSPTSVGIESRAQVCLVVYPSYPDLTHRTVVSATIRVARYKTNQTPNTPVITSPPNNSSFPYNDTTATSRFLLSWEPDDPDDVDGDEDYQGWEIQWRRPDGSGWTEWERFTIGVPATVAPLLRERESWAIEPMPPTSPGTWQWAKQGELKSIAVFTSPAGTGSGPSSWYKYSRVNIEPGTYQFRVRTYDGSAYGLTPETTPSSSRSPWSVAVTVHVTAPFLPPLPLSPINNVALWQDSVTFEWQFRDPRPSGGSQIRRWLRVRKVGDPFWTNLLVNQISTSTTYTHTNGALGFSFEPGFQYEWQVQTRSTPGNYDSGFSQSAYFWYIPAPNSGPELPGPEVTTPDAGLGCGFNRVFVYRRGGTIPVGEITGATKVDWSRVRDDISQANVEVSLLNAESQKCAPLLAELRSWLHEIVIFRDMGHGAQRVWEGPITRLTYTSDGVSIAARDVMVWPYRRIMRLGYNDAFRVVGRRYDNDGNIIVPGTVLSQPQKVTIRSSQILQNALAYDDPNILPYLTLIERDDDAKESRVVPEWSRGAWQEVDDLAAKAGLDYTTVGRRIILWDTHTEIGRLPEMRDGDFDTDPIVTEYGMQAANVYGVTNNGGVYGMAERESFRDEYGYIEMLSSAYGEDDEAGADITLTDEARARLEETLTGQAERNIAGRWPVPVVVRVPDNSTLNPDLNITINQLIPGVHIPLRSDSTLRKVAQLQKLDSMRCVQTADGEQIMVTMSPAPRSRDEDTDATGGGDGE